TDQPGGTTTVVSYSSTSSGPSAGSASDERETTGTSTGPSSKTAARVAPLVPGRDQVPGRVPPGHVHVPGRNQVPLFGSGPNEMRRSARTSTGAPSSRRVPYSVSCSASNPSTSAA